MIDDDYYEIILIEIQQKIILMELHFSDRPPSSPTSPMIWKVDLPTYISFLYKLALLNTNLGVNFYLNQFTYFNPIVRSWSKLC